MQMAHLSVQQPIVLLGGFLITAEAYEPMRLTLESLSGQPVHLVNVGRPEWLLTVFPFAWARILDRVDTAVKRLALDSPTGKVSLVGHSSGGIMLRLFLDDQPFQGRRYGGRSLANLLVMMGSPHTAIRATALRQMVDRKLPGAFFSDEVRYVSVAGDLDLSPAPGGAAATSTATATARRIAPTAYRNSTGNPHDRGDGLVPIRSAILAGSQPVVLKGVAHGGAFGSPWYGTPSVVKRWWRELTG
jgi:hypothetical protein